MAQLVEPLPQGYNLLEYLIEEVLGQGGFGTTYLCRDSNLRKQVVVKEFTPHRLVKRGPDGRLRRLAARRLIRFREASRDFSKRLANWRNSGIQTLCG